MARFLFVIPMLLLACAAFSAPAPEPFVSGWDRPVDPDGDCKIKRNEGALTIEMPGTDHDYDPIRKRFNAPRLLRDIEGAFEIRVRVRIDCQPSTQSTVKDQPAYVSAGFLLIYPETSRCTCERVEYAVSKMGSKLEEPSVRQVFGGKLDEPSIRHVFAEPRKERSAPKGIGAGDFVVMKSWLCKVRPDSLTWDRSCQIRHDLIGDRGWQEWPLPVNADHAYLRLELRDRDFYFFISPDGQKWTQLLWWSGPPDKLKLGLAAYSTDSEPSRVRFDRLRLTQGKKKKR